MTAGPATQISPSSPGGTSSVPSSAQIATEVSGSGTPMLPGRVSCQGHSHDPGDGLGQPVALEQPHVPASLGDELLEPEPDGLRQRVRAGERRPQRGEIGVLQGRMADERLVQRGHAGDQRRPLLADQLGGRLGAEHRHEDEPAAAQEPRVDERREAEPVEDRQRGENRVVRAETDPRPGPATPRRRSSSARARCPSVSPSFRRSRGSPRARARLARQPERVDAPRP